MPKVICQVISKYQLVTFHFELFCQDQFRSQRPSLGVRPSFVDPPRGDSGKASWGRKTSSRTVRKSTTISLKFQKRCSNIDVMWVKHCQKPAIWEWVIPPIYGDLGGWFMALFYQDTTVPRTGHRHLGHVS